MPSTYTDSLRLTLQADGENQNTWGQILNTVIGLIEDSIAGIHEVDITTGTDVTLSTADGATDQSRNMILQLNGTPTADINVIVPATSKIYMVDATGITNSNTVTVKTLGGTGISFIKDGKGLVYCDGTNVVDFLGGIADGSITEDKIADGAVSFDKLKNEAARAGKLLGYHTSTGDMTEIVIGDGLTFTDDTITADGIGNTYNTIPTGVPFPVWDDLLGIDPPDNTAGSARFVKLTANEDGVGEYNEGLLINETVTGTAPLVVATAEVSVSGSPINGETLHLINTEEAFLRARETSGDLQQDQMQRIIGYGANFGGSRGFLSTVSGAITKINNVPLAEYGNGGTGSSGLNFNSANSPDARASTDTGGETRSKNVSATYYMRVL